MKRARQRMRLGILGFLEENPDLERAKYNKLIKATSCEEVLDDIIQEAKERNEEIYSGLHIKEINWKDFLVKLIKFVELILPLILIFVQNAPPDITHL